MKIVVTGGLGHIGSRLIRELPGFFAGAEIAIIDNLATQRYPSLFDLPSNGRYRFFEMDVTRGDLRPIFSGADCVVHLAAFTDAGASFEHPEAMERVNFVATERVAHACADVGATLVHASSTSIYGTTKPVVDECCSQEDLSPQSPYAVTKRKEELLIEGMCQQADLKAMTFRFGTIFGTSPGMRFHTAVNRFCWQAVMGFPLSVWKTAYEQKRPYLDLSDAVRAIAFAIQNRIGDGRVYNAVTVNSSVKAVVDIIRGHVPTLKIDFVDSPRMNSLSYDVANRRLAESGFVFKGDMAQAIGQTINLLRAANQA